MLPTPQSGSSAVPAVPPPVASVQLMVGLEIHVELATATKMFSRAPSPAAPGAALHGPNTCIDPVVLALPGALPVVNRSAVEMAIRVGLALQCSIAQVTRWDRKSYFYPDLPKGYQISQYDLPLCFDGAFDLPTPAARQTPGGGPVAIDWEAGGGIGRRIGIIRAHLEEDAGKLLHEAPGGGTIDFSIVDYNRAGAPLLEIVTQPDFTTADEVVLFCQLLRSLVRFLGVSEGILQKGHIRFEPNINCLLTLADGHTVRTPIVEVKNLNSYRAVRGAIEHELREQPARWRQDGRVMGPGAKQTRGWDEQAQRTFVQREKEDAHDYRYFPDPDLLPVRIDRAWVDEIARSLPAPPLQRLRRYRETYGLGPKEAAALVEEREVCLFYEAAIIQAVKLGVPDDRAGKAVANLLLQSGARRANELAATTAGGSETPAGAPPGAPTLISDLGATPAQVGALAKLREDDAINPANADLLFGLLCAPEHREADALALAQARGLLTVRDEGAMEAWIDQAISENAKAADDVRAGKDAALGRLVGGVMKLAGGKADAKTARERLLAKLRPSG